MYDEPYKTNDYAINQNSIIEIKYNQQPFTVIPVENAVIAKAIKGDKKAFEKLYMGTYRYVFSIVRKYLKNDQDVYDAMQDTFTRVYKGLTHLESTSSFYPWLHRIATNCAKDILNANLHNTTVSFDEQTSLNDKDEQTEKSDIAADVTAVLNQLPPEQAELLIMVFYDKMRVSEIARMQGLAITTVHNRVKAAKKHLKKLLKIRGIDKPIYSGTFVSMLSIALRDAIGTELLSMAIAEEILHNITSTNNKKGSLVIANLAREMRNNAVKKIATILLFTCLIISLGAIIIAAVINKNFLGNNQNSNNNSINATVSDKTPNNTPSDPKPDTLVNFSSDNSVTENTDDASSTPNIPPNNDNLVNTEKIDSSATLKGSFSNSETFGTLTEDGYQNIAITDNYIYAVVSNSLIMTKKDDLNHCKTLINNFDTLYKESGCFLNVFENKVYWINQNSKGEFVLNRCNIDGSGHYTKTFTENGCTYITDLLIANDGVYFLAGKTVSDHSYTESATLYRTDYNFNLDITLKNVADFTLIKNKVYYLYGHNNIGVLFKADRDTFQNREKISPDELSYGSLTSVGEFLILGTYNKYKYGEAFHSTNLTVIDSLTEKIVRIKNTEAGDEVKVIDASSLDGGTIIYKFNNTLKALNITSGLITDMNTCSGAVCGKYKYFIKDGLLYASELDSTKTHKIY